MAGNDIVRYGFEAADGVPYHDSTYARFETESLQMTRPYEPDPNIDASGQETEGDSLKAEGKGKITAAPNTESWLRMRIQHRGYYSKTTPTSGVSRWTVRKFNPSADTMPAHYINSLWMGIWRDDGSEYNIMGARVNVFTATVGANKHIKYDHDLLFLRDRYMRNPNAIAVNAAYAGDLLARGHRRSGDEAGNYYKFKVVTPGALDGTATIVWGKGVAAYGATEYPVFANTWLPVMNADDTIAGTRREPIEIYFLPDVADVLTADDEWHIDPTSPRPVPSYTSRPKLTGVEAAVRFSMDGGSTYRTKVLEQFSIKGTTPIEADYATGSKYPQQIIPAGAAKEAWEFGFDRKYVDQDFLRALISGTRIAVETTFFGGFIGSTGLEEYHKLTMPLTKATVAGAVISTPGQLPEKVTLMGFSEAGSIICTEEIQNSIANVLPTT